MKYRQLGKSGLKVSVIGLGTMVHAGHFGPMKDEESLGAIDAALELGINFIDTSDAYGAGYSETLLGRALKGRRDKVILATKGGNVMVGPERGKRNFAVDYIDKVMRESLQRLATDYIDLYQLHNPTIETIQSGEIWALLERRKQEGVIRHYGVSINSESSRRRKRPASPSSSACRSGAGSSRGSSRPRTRSAFRAKTSGRGTSPATCSSSSSKESSACAFWRSPAGRWRRRRSPSASPTRPWRPSSPAAATKSRCARTRPRPKPACPKKSSTGSPGCGL